MSESFADMIGRRRVRLGLSQDAIARRIGVHQSTYSQWEMGRHSPNSKRKRQRVLDLLNQLESELVIAIMSEQGGQR